MTRPLFRCADLRVLEQHHAAATPPLMERAGAAAAQFARTLLPDAKAAVLICAGPGNNGGDAFVMARLLRLTGHPVAVVFRGAAERLPADARAAHARWLATGGRVHAEAPAGEYALVVDGLFGIGLARPIGNDYATLIARINAFAGPVLALDIPSGLDADTGRCLGATVRATHTLSFIAGKPGLYTLDGPDQCGAVEVNDLGLEIAAGQGALLDRSAFAAWLRPRRRNSHKGSYGSLGILGGAPGMAGAALLAGRAGLQLGAGRVYVGMLERLAVDPLQAELMLRSADETLAQASALVVGPGLGQSEAALAVLRQALDAPLPLLLDADALNLLAAHPVLAAHCMRRNAPTLLTPHPTEAARLLGEDTAAVQADRIATTQTLAARYRATVALKGCGTVIATPDGQWWLNPNGNPGLASGGTGDVLAGMAGALLAQGWPACEALLAAVHLHGAAADELVAAGCGPIGLTAGELIAPVRALLNRWIADA